MPRRKQESGQVRSPSLSQLRAEERRKAREDQQSRELLQWLNALLREEELRSKLKHVLRREYGREPTVAEVAFMEQILDLSPSEKTRPLRVCPCGAPRELGLEKHDEDWVIVPVRGSNPDWPS